jgi:hypothetical protein
MVRNAVPFADRSLNTAGHHDGCVHHRVTEDGLLAVALAADFLMPTFRSEPGGGVPFAVTLYGDGGALRQPREPRTLMAKLSSAR